MSVLGGHNVGRTQKMIDLLHDRLSKADRVIVQIERVLKTYRVERRANRSGGCYCVADRYDLGDPHTSACDRTSSLSSAAGWYLKKIAAMPRMLENDKEMLLFGIRNAVAGTAHKHGLVACEQTEEMIAAIAAELEDLGFRREKLNV